LWLLAAGVGQGRVAIAQGRLGFALLTQPHYRPLLTYFVGSGATVILWAWDWRLVLATGAGIGCLALLRETSPEQWRQWQTKLGYLSEKIPLTVGLAGMASLTTYLMATIWAESENRWLAIATMGQGLVSITTLGLLVWQVTIAQQQKGRDRYEQWLRELTAHEPLRRLMAVRQLSERVTQQELSSGQFQQLIEYFSLILLQETEESVRQAILESLQAWRVSVKPDRPLQPIQIPVRSPHPIIAD
jgi:hypothetical protein